MLAEFEFILKIDVKHFKPDQNVTGSICYVGECLLSIKHNKYPVEKKNNET